MPVYKVLIFLGVVGLAAFGLHLYALKQAVHMLTPSMAESALAYLDSLGVTLALTLLLCSYFTIGKLLSPRKFRWLAWASSLWMGLFSLIFLAALIFQITALILPSDPSVQAPWLGTSMLIAAVFFWFIGVHQATRPPRLERVTLKLNSLPDDLIGLQVVQISDIHIGPTIGERFTRQLVQRIQALQPDLIVITGDLVDGDVPLLADDVAPIFELEAPLGVYFITGNHELISGVDPWVDHLNHGGIEVLENQTIRIKHASTEFNLVGVEDWDSKRFEPTREHNLQIALEHADSSLFTLLLAHQPKTIEEASREGIDVQLSGHTHGGQIAPFAYLTYLDQPYRRGLYKVNDTLLYVNEGTGYWGPPLRLGTRSEITLFDLQQDA